MRDLQKTPVRQEREEGKEMCVELNLPFCSRRPTEPESMFGVMGKRRQKIMEGMTDECKSGPEEEVRVKRRAKPKKACTKREK